MKRWSMIPWNCRFHYTDKDGFKRVGKGRTFIIGGKEIELFPMGVLCGVIGRDRRTIYKWESHFGFPPALYRVIVSKRATRWYSKAQLLAIKLIYDQCGRLERKHRSKLSTFIASVRKVFYTLDQPIEIRKGITKDELLNAVESTDGTVGTLLGGGSPVEDKDQQAVPGDAPNTAGEQQPGAAGNDAAANLRLC